MGDEETSSERNGFGAIENVVVWRRMKRQSQKFLNGLILLALIIFVVIHLKGPSLEKSTREYTDESKHSSEKTAHVKQEPNTDKKKSVLKVPWRYQLEDDGFIFPQKSRREKFITYKPSPLSWPKQLLQFENALIFAYLLDRTLLVPPLVEQRRDANNIDIQRHFTMSNVLDFDLLSRVVSLKETSLKHIEEISNSSNAYKICHDHRLGFWVDFIPAVEDIQLWRVLRTQQITAFPVKLDDPDVDLMCPGTLQYGNRWGPPMKIKPIIRAILTELYDKEDDVIFFQGDTLSTRDFRFFDKARTKTLQKILIFNVQFSKGINMLLMQLIKDLGQTYNAILSGPIDRNESIRETLESRLRLKRFKETSRTLLVVSREADEKEFMFLKKHGYNLIFESEITRNIEDSRDGRHILRDLHELCTTLLCAYASKLIMISGPSEEYFVEHLRLQNVSMRDGLVMDSTNVRWAKHTQIPSKDERVLLQRQNVSKILHDIKIDKMRAGTNVTLNTRINAGNLTNALSLTALNMTKNGNETNNTNQDKTTPKMAIKKPRSKLDTMVCTFCMYIKRITGEHRCPTIAQWCN